MPLGSGGRTQTTLIAWLDSRHTGAIEGVDIGKKIEAMTVFVCTATLYVMTKTGEFASQVRWAWRARTRHTLPPMPPVPP